MNIKLKRKNRRSNRLRFNLKKKSHDKLRLSVFRSNMHFYAQLIDDKAGRTLIYQSTLDPEIRAILNRRLNEKSVTLVAESFVQKYNKISNKDFDLVFDRGCHSYAGLVSKFVDTIRSLGIKV